MGNGSMVLIIFFAVVCLGQLDSARAESPGPGPKPKDTRIVVQEAMAFISGIAHIEFSDAVSDKERRDYYAVAMRDKCLMKISDEITIIQTASGKNKGVIYTETTLNTITAPGV